MTLGMAGWLRRWQWHRRRESNTWTLSHSDTS